MPTHGRRAYVPTAIACFLAQDYPRTELIILDGGPDPVEDLVPPDKRIRYYHDGSLSPRGVPLGTKRNKCNSLASGTLLAHWDDDDWHAPQRLSVLVAALLATPTMACAGLSLVSAYRPATDDAWLYRWHGGGPQWVWDGTSVYTKESWERAPFPDVAHQEGRDFLRTRAGRILPLERPDLYCVTIHTGPAGNNDPKRPVKTLPAFAHRADWRPLPTTELPPGAYAALHGGVLPAPYVAPPTRRPAPPAVVPADDTVTLTRALPSTSVGEADADAAG